MARPCILIKVTFLKRFALEVWVSIHTYIHTYIQTDRQTDGQTSACVLVRKHHTYNHICIHILIHTYMYFFFSNFEKAFDSIDHAYIICCLKHFNFGEDFVKWVKSFYNDAKSCVTNNGYLSNFPFCEAFVRDVPFPLISSSYVLNYFQIR